MPVEQVIGPVQARVRGHFAKPQATAREAVLAALGSQRYFSLLDELDRLLADPPLTERAATPAADALPVPVRRGYRQVARRMRRAWRAPAGEPRNVALHQARKAAKRARYAGEAVHRADEEAPVGARRPPGHRHRAPVRAGTGRERAHGR